MPPAARKTDPTSHGTPCTPGPGSPDITIGMLPAWRALPASVGGAVEGVSNDMKSFMTEPALTPASAAPKLAKVIGGLSQSAAAASAEGNPAAGAAVASQVPTLMSTTISLSVTWASASAVPGGQPAANEAFTKGIQAATAAAATAVFSAIGGMTDMHNCPVPVPIPPHGPGMVTKASTTVEFNNLPACRQDDKLFEACGGPDPIAMGDQTVLIGDDTGSGEAPPDPTWTSDTLEGEELDVLLAEETPAEALTAEAAFVSAAYYGTPLVNRCKPCDGV